MHLFLSQEEALFQWLGLAGFMGKHQSPLHLTDTWAPNGVPTNVQWMDPVSKFLQKNSKQSLDWPTKFSQNHKVQLLSGKFRNIWGCLQGGVELQTQSHAWFQSLLVPPL